MDNNWRQIMTDDIEEKSITIIIKDHDYMNPKVMVKGSFNGSQSRRVLAAAGKHIRVEATRAHYDKQYADEARQKEKDDAATHKAEQLKEAENARENERLAKELADKENDDKEKEVDEDLPESGDDTNMDATAKDDNDLSYLSDSDNGNKKED